MDDVDTRYSISVRDHGREVWLECAECLGPVKAYSLMGFQENFIEVRTEFDKHEKKFHTERTEFLVDFTDGIYRSKLRVHGSKDCKGEFCMIHNPSMHHMRFWPITFSPIRHYLAFRTCFHGTEHPDPDSLAYMKLKHFDSGAHECCADSCCIEED